MAAALSNSDIVFYPADGGTPRIIPIPFVDLNSLYGPENEIATRERIWDAYKLTYNMSPDLPINLAMARLVKVDPQNPGQRLLWRGDAFVVSMPPEGIRYLGPTSEVMDLFNSTLIPDWYNSFEWRNFLSLEQQNCAFRRTLSPNAEQSDEFSQIFLDNMGRLLEQLKAIATSHNVLLYPASRRGRPRIVSMIFAERDNSVRPLGFERIDIDVQGLYGQENLFAAYQVIWTSSTQAELDTNERGMARLVGVDPRRPPKRPLWRGDVVVVKWRQWRGEHPDYVDMTGDILDRLNSRIIPDWYNSYGWGNLLDEETEFNERILRPGSWFNPLTIFLWFTGDYSRYRNLYEKRVRMIERLRAISVCATSPIVYISQ
ncbi:hypothetical protein B0H14DRAFT_2845202 [Mycena olivaceomarginata]|nr:hypothetical protein B0H14DRAFT_2845202 [Mycena olivaceomarginata]